MKKKIISILLTIVMTFMLFPSTVYAKDSTWLTFQQAVQSSGTVTLTNDVICDNQEYGPITIPEGVNVTIDLNGYKIDRNLTEAVDKGAVIDVYGSLTVKDDSCAKTGTITGGKTQNNSPEMVAGGIQVNGGSLVLESGSITGCSASMRGAGVNVEGGSFIMKGGSISENRARSHGAGVDITSGTFTMTGGIISENSAVVGGGVYATQSDLFLSGGEISGNTASNESGTEGSGGGLNVEGDVNVTLTGCKITGNTALKGGGVRFWLKSGSDYKFNVGKDTVITGNTDANGNPSNLYLNNFNQKTMLTVMDGENAPNGMNIGISSKTTPTDLEPVQISDASASIGDLGYFSSDVAAYDLIYMGDNIQLATKDMCGVTFISGVHGTDPAPVLIKKGSLLTHPANPTEYGYSFLGWYKDAALQDAWDFDNDIVEDNIILYGKWEDSTWLTFQQVVQSSGTVTLTRDVVCDNQAYGPIVVPDGVTVTIDLNGHTINRNLSDYVDNGLVIDVYGNLTVKDGSSEKTGTITGGKNTGAGNTIVAGGIQLNGGALVLESGSITGCLSEERGAGVNVESGSFLMKGGSISENRARSHGAGVNITSGTFTMTGGIISENSAVVGGGVYATQSDLFLSGGEISGNSATDFAGGLNAAGDVNVTLTGCKITGNTATKGGGVRFYLVDYGDYSFNVGKNTLITGNTDANGNPSNLYLNNFNQKTMLTVMDGENAPNGMNIGISSSKNPTDSAPIQISDTTMQKAYSDCFFSDNDSYSLFIMDNTLYMTDAVKITADTRVLTSGWYILSESVTLPEGEHITVNGDVHLILCDGCELKIPSPDMNCAGIELTDGGALGSSDSLTVYGQKNGTGSIVAYGGSGAAGIGSDNNEDSGKLTINGGMIMAYGGNNAAGIGGGRERDCGEVTIYGGTVTATGGSRAAGIGNGYEGVGGTVNIYGGTVKAYGNGGMALGGESNALYKNKVNIYGGDIFADSKSGNDAVVAYSIKLYGNSHNFFTLKDSNGNKLPFSPVAVEKDLYNALPGHNTVHIELQAVHNFTGDYVDNGDGTHSRKCTVCGELSTPENHTYKDGVCNKCGSKIITVKDTAIIKDGYIYGLAPKLTSLTDYIDVAEGYELEYSTDTIGTGTTVNVLRNGEVVDAYTTVIFGDVNNDGIYDGMDAMIVNCLANGMLTREQVGEAVYMAADCNHDGTIDSNDVDILQQAGVLLASVDQSKSQGELQTDSAYVEYLNLIDQNPVNEETEKEQTPSALDKLIKFIADIYALLNNLINFIKTIFA